MFELKNFKKSEFASEETLCFQATLYHNGVAVAKVRNQGIGGSNMYHATADTELAKSNLAEALAGLQRKIDEEDLHWEFSGDKIPYSIDGVIDDLIFDVEVRKSVRRHLAKSVCFVKEGSEGIRAINFRDKEHRDMIIERLKGEGATIVNTMDLPKAVEFWKENQ